MESKIAESATTIFNINTKPKIFPLLGSRRNQQVTHDCMERIGLKEQYQQRHKLIRIDSEKTRLVPKDQ